jgi:hypothetical protein
LQEASQQKKKFTGEKNKKFTVELIVRNSNIAQTKIILF